MAKRTEHGTVSTAAPKTQAFNMQAIAEHFNENLPIHPPLYRFSGGREFNEVNFYELSLSELQALV